MPEPLPTITSDRPSPFTSPAPATEGSTPDNPPILNPSRRSLLMRTSRIERFP